MDFDIIVIGAGPAGLCAAAALAARGHTVGVVERLAQGAVAEPEFDGREIALTHRSERILRENGVWARLPAQEISELREAVVLNGRSPRRLRFAPARARAAVLGHLVPNHRLRRAAYLCAAESRGVTLLPERTVVAVHGDARDAAVRTAGGEVWRCRLVIAADSRHSPTRRAVGIAADMLDFGKTMLVCRMQHRQPHAHVATEWFQETFTIATLPLNGDESSIVITETASEAARLHALETGAFEREVRRRLEDRLGALRLSSSRHLYPLVATWARRFVGTRLALIGDAAIGMHPVTAHGFNLALQSQETLAGEIARAAASGSDIGAGAVLRRYESRHRRTGLPLYLGTNAIVRLYTDRRPLAAAGRALGLRIASAIRPLNGSIVDMLTDSGVR